MERLIYTTSSGDPLHREQLEVFLYSMAKNGGADPILLDLVNWEAPADYLLKLNPFIMDIRHKTYDVREGQSTDNPELTSYALDVMYSRPLGVLEVLGKDVEMICSIDTDMIIRKPIHKIWQMEDSDIAVYFRKNKRPHMKFQGGLVVYKNSEKMRVYYQDLVNILKDERERVYSCQEQMYELAKIHKLKIRDLGEKYNDSSLSKSSRVWHIKHSHYGNKVWKKEFNRYLAEAKSKI